MRKADGDIEITDEMVKRVALELHRCEWPGGYGWRVYMEMARAALSAALGSPPSAPIRNTGARAEAEERYPTGIVGLVRYEDWERDNERNAFIAGSEWQASQPCEVRTVEPKMSPTIRVRRDQHFNPSEYPSGTVVIFI